MTTRRKILQVGAAFAAGLATLPRAPAHARFAPKPGTWRTFEVHTKIALAPEGKGVQAWVPLPAVNETSWFRSMDRHWATNGRAEVVVDATSGARMLHITWAEGGADPIAEIHSKVQTRDRATNFVEHVEPAPLSPEQRRLYTAGTSLIPVDGIVKTTAERIVSDAATDFEKAHVIYAWVVDNTFRDPASRGCGIGDIAAMLKSGNLGGKCADLNALYVGLARAAGLPARDVYGIRVAPSRFGYHSLGANSPIVTNAQHCRAEVYLDEFGWIPVDPADVRKVVLEEPPKNLALDDPRVTAARRALFGAWEGNWLAYNFAHDVTLPGSSGPRLGFLMYPQAEIAGMRLDCLDPENFRYEISAREVDGA